MTSPNRELPRTTIAVVTILFLLIASLFIVQPLLVRGRDGGYELIAGERR